jgi:hypothetical protein
VASLAPRRSRSKPRAAPSCEPPTSGRPSGCGSNRTGRSSHHARGATSVAPSPLASCHETCPIPLAARTSRNEKAPQIRGFHVCAEEDSNLHPVIPDQALNLITRCQIRPMRPYCPERPRLWTHRTQWTIWMLPRMLPRAVAVRTSSVRLVVAAGAMLARRIGYTAKQVLVLFLPRPPRTEAAHVRFHRPPRAHPNTEDGHGPNAQ